MKITLTNNFHNTSATFVPRLVSRVGGYPHYWISRATARRLKRTLCPPYRWCSCSGILGESPGLLADAIEGEDGSVGFVFRDDIEDMEDYKVIGPCSMCGQPLDDNNVPYYCMSCQRKTCMNCGSYCKQCSGEYCPDCDCGHDAWGA